jgi:hypothetical protein
MRSWVVVLTLAGCTRVNTSTLPPYARDIRAAVGGVELVQCEVIVTTKRENTFWDSNKTTREISMGNCWNQVISTEPPAEAPVELPPPPTPPPPSPAPVRPGGVR